MKRTLTLMLVITLLAALPVARAEAWETAADIFLNPLNDDIRRNDPDAHLYTGSNTISGMYQTFYCPDGCFAMVYADDGESALTGIELFCEDAACVRRRLDDVAYLAYCLGSRDSIEAVSSWCDRWDGPIRDAMSVGKDLDSDPCDCPAFTASLRVYQNDAGSRMLRITLTL